MPRTFTAREREYMAKLAARNLGDVEEVDNTDGLETPMPAKERMKRKRIREKAQTAIRDLVLADLAGVLDYDHDSLAQAVSDEQTAAMIGLMGIDDETDRVFAAIGEPPETVDF